MNKIVSFVLLTCFIAISCGNPKNLIYQDVKNFRLMQLSLQPEIGMDVQFYNPNTFGLTMKDADINVFINDKLIGNSKLANTFHVPANDTFLLPVILKADLRSIFANSLSILANKQVKVGLRGNVKSGRGIFVNIPINYVGIQRLNVLDLK